MRYVSVKSNQAVAATKYALDRLDTIPRQHVIAIYSNGFGAMRVDKDIVIDLFERKDKKRRKILYELYAELVLTSLSAHYVAEMINSDLEKPELIDVNDVRYCRYYFRKRTKPFDRVPLRAELLLPSPAPEPRPEHNHNKSVKSPNDVPWSDGDAKDMQDKISITTKFINKNET